MGAISSISDLIDRSSGGSDGNPQNAFWYKNARINGVAAAAPALGRPLSLWLYDGFPGRGVAPTTVEAPTNATAGALPFTNPSGGRQAWMTQCFATTRNGGSLLLYDRLLHIGSLNGSLTTPQTIGGSITRNTSGAGNFVMLENYADNAGKVYTINYTNQDGTSGRVSPSSGPAGSGGNNERIAFASLADGDTGVRAVANITFASAGAVSNYGITIGKPIAYLTTPTSRPRQGLAPSGGTGWRDYITGLPGIPNIEANACLALVWWSSTTTNVPFMTGGYSIVEA
jgi:hypothetical protein